MDLKPIFDSLYDKLVLRDLIGKVVPGTALMLSLLAGLQGVEAVNQVVTKMTSGLWIIAFGFAWLLGFALQYIGESLHILRTHPHGEQGNETRGTFYKKWATFHEKAKKHELIHAERLNIIKEACGNEAVSLMLGLVMVVLGRLIRGIELLPLLPLLIIGIVLAISLWRMHIIHVERYGRFVENTIGFRKKGKRGKSVQLQKVKAISSKEKTKTQDKR